MGVWVDRTDSKHNKHILCLGLGDRWNDAMTHKRERSQVWLPEHQPSWLDGWCHSVSCGIKQEEHIFWERC